MQPDLSCEGTGFGDGGDGLREGCSEGDCVAPPGLVTAHPVKLYVEVLLELLRKQSDQLQASSHRVTDAAMMRCCASGRLIGADRGQDCGTEGGGTEAFGSCNFLESKLLGLGISGQSSEIGAKSDGGPKTKSEEEGRQKTS